MRTCLQERLSSRPALASITISAGLVDTNMGFEDVLQRADREVTRARAEGFDRTGG